MKKFINVFTPILISVLAATLAGVLLQSLVGKEYFLEDIGGIGWLLGVVGTIYTLVAAFTMVEVWNQFNNISNLISREAKAITSIWNYTDYLNDNSLDKKMRKVLISYISVATNNEHKMSAKSIRPPQSSIELINILRVIDKIKFDDQRDATIFPLLTGAYEELAAIRSDRLEAGVTRLPSMIKIFFIALSLMLMISYILVGYVHLPLYLIHTIFGASIISLTYKIIIDLDNPFDGIWNIDYTSFTQAKDHITSQRHEK